MAKRKAKRVDKDTASRPKGWGALNLLAIWLVLAALLVAGYRDRQANARSDQAITRLTQQLNALEARPLGMQLALEQAKTKELYDKGVDHYVNNHIPEAMEAWLELLKIDPNHADAQKNLYRARKKIAALERGMAGAADKRTPEQVK